MRILLVENDTSAAERVVRTLQQAGHRCDVIGTERKCLRRFFRDRYDVMFIDLENPEIDPERIVRLVRKRSPDTTVVPFSAQDDESVMKRMFSLGVAAYLTKPVASDTVAGVMQHIEASHPPLAFAL